MTYDELRQYIDAAERGELEYSHDLEKPESPHKRWRTIGTATNLVARIYNDATFRIAPKPVWRAWETVDEVPVGAWVKWNHLTDELSRICSAELTDVGLLVQCGEDKEVGADMLFHNAQLTTDLKTFTPCGVEVK